MKKRFLMLLAALLLACVGTACAGAEILSVADLNDSGRKVGISMGSAAEEAMRQEVPNAAIEYYTDNFMGYLAVAQGKLDAYVYDLAQMERAIHNGQSGVRLLPETMRYTVKIAVGVSPVSRVPDLTDKVNQFIREMREKGTLDDMYQRWVLTDSPQMPVIELPENPQYQLVVGTTGTVPPYSYYEGEGLTGYDIELAYRFAAWLGAGVRFDIYDFGSIVSASGAGKIDLAMSNLQYLPERTESNSLIFSDVLFEEKMGIMVRQEKAAAAPQGVYTSLDQLDGKRIGVQTGTTAADIARGRLPNIEISYFTTFPDMAMALKTNKIDGFPGDGLVLKQMAHEDPSLVVLDEMLRTYDCGFVLAKSEKGKALQAEMNEWLRGMRASGELDRILIKWTEGPESEQTVPEYKSLPAPKGTLTMTTEGTFPPMNYYRGEECVGMEIELCALFCRDCGYGLNVTTMDFDGMLAAVQSGKVDFAISGIAITEERKESVLFSDPYYTGGTMMAVLRDDSADTQSALDGGYTSLDQLATARIGVQTGTTFNEIVLETFPEARISYFNSYPDMAAAVKTRKIDAFPGDEPVLRMMVAEDDRLMILDGQLDSFEFGMVFPKNEAGAKLRDEMNAWLSSMNTSGKLDQIIQKWTDGPESEKTISDYASLPATNGTLKMVTEGAYAPMNYYRGDEIVGMEIDLAAQFCEANGYALTVEAMNFDGILSAIQAGKANFAAAGLSITEERKESVYFSDPYYTGGTVLAVLKTETASLANAAETRQGASFLDGIMASFEKTFIRENRWMLFAQGIGTTLLITALSILCGTALGFGVFMLCRNGNPLANGVTRFSMWLVQGTPMVVLLMILYYIIFGSVAISGMLVAVIGFSLTFGSSVFGLLKMGVGAVDGGQYEAAYALGYSNRRTFFRIILPQALPHVLSAYKGEIVGLIKATAIVGYIAVQDLTKMGDIVRSRTYEAFFPLIAITIIYFALEGLLSFLVGRIGVSFNPKRRKPADILKGVKTDD